MLDGDRQERKGTLGIKAEEKIEGSDNINGDDWSWNKKRMMIEFDAKFEKKMGVVSFFNLLHDKIFHTVWVTWVRLDPHVHIYINYNIKKYQWWFIEKKEHCR